MRFDKKKIFKVDLNEITSEFCELFRVFDCENINDLGICALVIAECMSRAMLIHAENKNIPISTKSKFDVILKYDDDND